MLVREDLENTGKDFFKKTFYVVTLLFGEPLLPFLFCFVLFSWVYVFFSMDLGNHTIYSIL